MLDPVRSSSTTAISGAGPPAMTEPTWYPRPAPLGAQMGPEGFRDQNRLGPVLHVVGYQGEHGRQDDQPSAGGVYA